VINQSHKGLCVISLVKILNLSNAGNDMICLFHIHFSIYITAKLGVINNQFLRVLRFLRGLNFLKLSLILRWSVLLSF
jgi:hypothetical protein